MKTLTLLRHAKSDLGDRGMRDFDRPLNAKGHRAAATIGRHLKSLGIGFDAVIASPAARVVATVAELDSAMDGIPEPRWEQRAYLASSVTLIELVRAADDAGDRLLLVAHNPGLEDLVLAMVPDGTDASLRDDVEEKFPTASIAVIEFDVPSWGLVDEGEGALVRFIRPRDLDPALGPDRD